MNGLGAGDLIDAREAATGGGESLTDSPALCLSLSLHASLSIPASLSLTLSLCLFLERTGWPFVVINSHLICFLWPRLRSICNGARLCVQNNYSAIKQFALHREREGELHRARQTDRERRRERARQAYILMKLLALPWESAGQIT